jgi:hypothetical protein
VKTRAKEPTNADKFASQLTALGGKRTRREKSKDGTASFEVFTFRQPLDTVILYRFYSDPKIYGKDIENAEYGFFKVADPDRFIKKRYKRYLKQQY